MDLIVSILTRFQSKKAKNIAAEAFSKLYIKQQPQ